MELEYYFRKHLFNAKQEQKEQETQKAKSKMAAINQTVSIITLNVNGLNSPI